MEQVIFEEVTPTTVTNQKRELNGKSPFPFPLASVIERDYRVIVTSEVAQWILDHMHPEQRRTPTSRVAIYRDLIRSGRFVEFMEPGIYFDQNGYAVNAKHRLTAQVEEGATLGWRLKVGASSEQVQALDQVNPRREYQSVNLTTGNRMTSREQAVIRQLARIDRSSGGTLKQENPKLSVDCLLRYRERFGDGIAWSIANLPKQAAPAGLTAAVAYAYCAEHEVVASFVEEFLRVRMGLGGYVDERSAATALARWLFRQSSRAGGQYATDVLMRTMSAIWLFIQGRRVQRLDINATAIPWFRNRNDGR